jgi:lipopolysaccharide transport system ATP-binding protein
MTLAIKVENLSKIYRLGEIGTGTISRDMERWFRTRVLKQEDPFLRIGETNDRTSRGESDIVYSLRDINFEINQGDAVGIIGRNGAGKSTLLKILSRVTTPTTGRINIKGRVASLLEVGTGFHPELTGRENIFLNGAILGMRKREIDRKLDEIIDFSGVERYIDTPVKRYSSGMYVRLAFAVAAHLESEILIVDEVLAVGDAEFQKKCLGKMGEVSKGEGRTVLFVSHNLDSVNTFCNTSILMDRGTIAYKGVTEHVIEKYYINESSETKNVYIANKNGIIPYLKEIKLINEENQLIRVFDKNSKKKSIISVQFELPFDITGIDCSMCFKQKNKVIFTTSLKDSNLNLFRTKKWRKGIYKYEVTLPFFLKLGIHSIDLALTVPNIKVFDIVENVLLFNVVDVNDPTLVSGEGRVNDVISPTIPWIYV